MSQYDVPENDAREIMLLPKEGEPTDWIANDGSENVISIAFPAVVTKGPPLSGLKVVLDYKYPRDIPSERIRATLFQETGKKRQRMRQRVYQIEVRSGKISSAHQLPHEHIGTLRLNLDKVLNFSECLDLFCERCNLTICGDQEILDPGKFELLP